MEIHMNVSLRQSAPTYGIKNAVLLYGANADSIDLVTLHTVVEGKEGLVIKEGHPATKQALLSMLESVSEHVRKPLRVLHENVIAVSDEALVWWEPAQKRRIAFANKQVGKRASVVPHPALLFVVYGGGWFVYALAESKRPTAETSICVSPYFNVWSGGSICTGSTALPKAEERDNPEAWTKAFFKSAFTHPNIDTKDGLVKYKGGPFAFWRDVLNGKFEAFPTEVLVKTKRTVREVIEACQKGGRDA
jgi:PRTRC genetic system protein B